MLGSRLRRQVGVEVFRGGTSLRFAAAALCVVATVVALSCADDADEPPAAGTAGARATLPPNVVSDSDIDATPRASPERTLLRFFQAVQFQDVEAARRLATDAGPGSVSEADLRRVLSVVGPALGKVRLLSVRKDGDTAVIRALVLGFAGEGKEPATVSPASFTLRRESDRWRLSDLFYFTNLSDSILRDRRRQAAGK